MKQYQDLLRYILANGEEHEDRTGVGTLSVFGYQVRFDLRDSFPLLTTKKIPFRWVAEELFWFLSGDTNEATLRSKGVDIWKEWANEEHTSRFKRAAGDLGPVYGYLWRSFGGNYPQRDGVDQLARVVLDLEVNPNSRRHIVSGWHPRDAVKVDLPPCHTLFQFKVHSDNSLSCHLYARSIDSFLGLPFNIASYALLTRLMAHVTELSARELIISFGDLHIYKNHLPQVEVLLSREPYPSPTLTIQDSGDYLTIWSAMNRGLEGLLAMRYENLKLSNYQSHSKIEAEVAV